MNEPTNNFAVTMAAVFVSICAVVFTANHVAGQWYDRMHPPAVGPAVTTNFQALVAGELALMGDEEPLVRALFEQMATSLEFDGTRPAPIVTQTHQVGEKFQALQHYRVGQESPFGDRWFKFEGIVGGEVERRLGLTGQSQDLTPDRRAAAVAIFREVASAH